MKLHELMARTDWYDGELVLNGHNFSSECSFCFSQTNISESALKEFGDVLNADYLGRDKDGNILLENKNISENEVFKQGRKFLLAHSGFISAEKYDEYFMPV